MFACAGNHTLPDQTIERLILGITNPDITTGDMDLAQYVRALYCSDSQPQQQSELLAALQELYDNGELRLWITKRETNNIYWTENHMILWLGSTLLLRDKLRWDPNDDAFVRLEERLEHWLDLKLQYRYEWFSTNYIPFTVAGCLNLVDFASSAAIADKAERVASLFLEDWLLQTTTLGQYYPVANRNRNRHYSRPEFRSITWMLTGLGNPLPDNPWLHDYVGAYLATTSMDFEPVAARFERSVSRKLRIGHETAEHKTLHKSMTRTDHTFFQWSAGVYVEPGFIADTMQVLQDWKFASHRMFPNFLWPFLNQLWTPLLAVIVYLLPGQTRATNASLAKLTIYKNDDVMLSSLEDFHVGERGTDQWPLMATVGDTAVWTQSGVSGRQFRPDLNAVSHSHFPQVVQSNHVALISYRPKFDVRVPARFLGWVGVPLSTQVSLSFNPERFDETKEVGNWLLGRRGTAYVGVWRHALTRNDCRGTTMPCTEYWYSNPAKGMSVWAVVVGNNISHGDFDGFVDAVSTGEVKETVPGLFARLFGASYATSLNVDGIQLQSDL